MNIFKVSLLVSLLIYPVLGFPQDDPFNAYIVQISPSNQDGRVSIAIKDNIDLIGWPTTAGSLAMLDNIPTQNAFIVTK